MAKYEAEYGGEGRAPDAIVKLKVDVSITLVAPPPIFQADPVPVPVPAEPK